MGCRENGKDSTLRTLQSGIIQLVTRETSPTSLPPEALKPLLCKFLHSSSDKADTEERVEGNHPMVLPHHHGQVEYK